MMVSQDFGHDLSQHRTTSDEFETSSLAESSSSRNTSSTGTGPDSLSSDDMNHDTKSQPEIISNASSPESGEDGNYVLANKDQKMSFLYRQKVHQSNDIVVFVSRTPLK